MSQYEGTLKHVGKDNYKIGGIPLVIPNCKYKEGSYINKGDVLTNSIVNVKSYYNQTHDILATQLHLLDEYAETYYGSNIDINGRHFELCVKSQTQRVVITDPKDSDFKLGEIYKFGEVFESNEIRDDDDKIEYEFVIMGVKEVVREEDLMLSLSFEDIDRKIIKSIASTKYIPARSTIGKIVVGESIEHPKTIDLKIAKKAKSKKTDKVEKEEVKKKNEEKLNESLDIEDFSTMMQEETKEIDRTTSVKKSKAFS